MHVFEMILGVGTTRKLKATVKKKMGARIKNGSSTRERLLLPIDEVDFVDGLPPTDISGFSEFGRGK